MTEPVWHTLEYVVSWARPWDGLFLAEEVRALRVSVVVTTPRSTPPSPDRAAHVRPGAPSRTTASAAVLLVRRHGQHAVQLQHVRRAVTR